MTVIHLNESLNVVEVSDFVHKTVRKSHRHVVNDYVREECPHKADSIRAVKGISHVFLFLLLTSSCSCFSLLVLASPLFLLLTSCLSLLVLAFHFLFLLHTSCSCE